MCTPGSLRRGFTALNIFKAALFLYLIGFGSYLCGNVDWRRGYGNIAVNYGAGLIIIGLIVPFNTFAGYQGSQDHNKYLLCQTAFVDGVLLIAQVSIGTELMLLTASEVDSKTQRSCIASETEDSCGKYLKSGRFIGMKLIWAAHFDLAHTDTSEYAKMIDWQKAGRCCGFGPPLRCEENGANIPEEYSLDGVPRAWSKQVTKCGQEPDWYPRSGSGRYECYHYVDSSAASPTYGGCEYEMPLGDCMDEYPEADSIGCADYIQSEYDAELYGNATAVLFFALFEAVTVIFACCFCWKRKAHDVIPMFLERDPADPYPEKSTSVELRAPVVVGSEEHREEFEPVTKTNLKTAIEVAGQ